MKHESLSSSLCQLRGVLKSAIDHCNSIRDASDEIQSAVTDYSLSCLSIEKVVELARSSESVDGSAARHGRLLEQHLRAAKIAGENIRNTTTTYHHACLGPKAKTGATRFREFTQSLLLNLSRIIAALNSAILLVSIHMNNEHTCMLVAKLRSLINSCHKAHGFSRKSVLAIVSRGSERDSAPHETNDTEVRQLLQPANIAYIVSELHAVHAHAGAAAFATSLPPRNAQLLNINLLGLLLERQPICPTHVPPALVSYHSEVIVAARAGDYERLSQILSDSPELLYCFTIDNLTLMYFAIESGEIKMIEHLLQKGIDVNNTYGRNDTCPLATALQFRHLHIAIHLLRAGAKLDHRNNYGWSPLFYIWFKEDRSSSAGPLLGLLAANSDFHVMHRNVYDKYGWSIMHRAAIYGASRDVATLIQLGVDPFAVTKAKDRNPTDDNIYDYSVLQQVVLDGLTDTVEVLLPVYYKKFGNIDLPDERGWTLLHMAIQEQHLAVIRMLVENGADLWAKTETTLIDRVGDTGVRRYTPFSLAKSFGPQFFKSFLHIVRKYHQQSRCVSLQAGTKRLCDPLTPISPKSRRNPMLGNEQKGETYYPDLLASKPFRRIDHRKVFGETTVSGHASAHMGDSFRHYYITNNRFGKRSSISKLKRLKLRRKVSQQVKCGIRRRVSKSLNRNGLRGRT